MSSSLKTALLAVVSVLAAIALVLAGILLAAAIPELDAAAERVLGRDDGAVVEEGGASTDADFELQSEILQRLKETYYETIDLETLSEGAIDGLLAGLDDPYTVYYDPDEYADLIEESSGSYSGVGMVLMMDGRLPTVVSVFEGSPAAEAAIEAGDIILSVAGLATSGRTLDEVVADIKGEEGTQVSLRLYRPLPPTTTSTTLGTDGSDEESEVTPEDADSLTVDLTGLPEGGTEQTYSLTRRSIVIPTTKTTILEEGDTKVAHIVLYTFNNMNTSEELRAEVESAVNSDNVDAIILDMRGNGGGLLDEAVKVAGIFIRSGVIVSTEGLHSEQEELRASGNAVTDLPLYVLVDRYSASASEIVAGALQDYSRGILVGETTFGKGLVQSIEPLSNGGAVKVTTAVYLTPKGRNIHETGIDPDVSAPDDPASADVDETLQKALELILTDR
jgi:carboxyl-terminal processing protease